MNTRPERLAHWLFELFEVSPRPPIDLETLASRMGIDQILDADMIEDGRLVQSSDRAVVHLRRNLNPRRRRFTLAPRTRPSGSCSPTGTSHRLQTFRGL